MGEKTGRAQVTQVATVVVRHESLSGAPREGRRTGIETGVVFTTEDVEADHEHLLARGVDVDEAIMGEGEPVVYWADAPLAGVPAMFRFRDPDGNSFLMVQRI